MREYLSDGIKQSELLRGTKAELNPNKRMNGKCCQPETGNPNKRKQGRKRKDIFSDLDVE